MYGQTEATARISYLPFEALPGKIGSIGKAIPGGTLWLEDANGNRISQSNTDGVMIYEGPNAMMGYALCRSDLMKKDELSGVLRTGDIARFDDDGFFYLTGRENRFVKILGNRVNLDDIENHLRAHAVECLCGGHDEKLKIAIKGAHDIKEIEKLIIDRYKFPKFLFSIRNVDEFMQTASGKPDYAGTFANHP
jgi:acyl-coenzyme A synthetase/AMP-(fatty) acid ligase